MPGKRIFFIVLYSATVSEAILSQKSRLAIDSGARAGDGSETLRYPLAFFRPYFLAVPPGSTVADDGARTARVSRPILTGTLSSIADTQHSEEDTYAMRRLFSPRHFAAAPVTTAAAAATATVAQLQTPEEYTLDPPLGPGPPGPRHARARARATALVLNAYLLSFAFASGSEQHARYAK